MDRGFYRVGILAQYASQGGPTGYQFLHQEGYAGFRFVAGDGKRHYGWIRLRGSARGGRLFEYAFEATPGASIVAGTKAAARLNGSVNRTTFPPEGGTLRYTFTARNLTAAPLSLDLWSQVEHKDGDAFVRRLGSGTLAPGATLLRTAELSVPPSASSGVYEVDFKLGDFGSGQFITFERFTVTKAPAARITEGRGEPLAASPFEGDLFSSAAASAAGFAGTHALSVPFPNPSDSRAALTLTVAEAQAVRVAVLDALGRQVALLHDGPMAPGAEHRFVFDGSTLPSGVYVVRAVGETFSDTRVLTLTR
jgi:hypothetical protein